MNSKIPKKRISNIIRSYLFRVFLIVLLSSSLIAVAGQLIDTRQESMELIEANIKDVVKTMDEEFLKTQLKDYTAAYCKRLENNIYTMKDILNDDIINLWLRDMVKLNSEIVTEINIYDSNGINIYSSEPENIGYDMSLGKQSSKFLCLLKGTDYYEQDFQITSSDRSKVMKYAGMAFANGEGFFQLGISEEKYKQWKEESLAEEVRHRRIGFIGYMAVLNGDFECIGSSENEYNGMTLDNTDILPENEGEYKRSTANMDGSTCFLVVTLKDGYYILGSYPVKETMKTVLRYIIISFIIIVILLISTFAALSGKLDTGIVKPILNTNDSLAKITEGDLTERVTESSSLEFEELSTGINRTVERLNQMIEEATRRIDMELETARVIQSTSLPNVFPPFPNRKEISLFAMMDTAKKVGGDFYDYYMISENRLAFVIADVSDKGIPAALFMMKAMSVIKTLAASGLEVDKVMERTNDELVKNNEAGMFVTVWIGFLQLDTGMVNFVHAGHTCPYLIRNGRVSKLRKNRDLIVGSMPDVEYQNQKFQLLPNDTLFLYTDGVTEAFDINLAIYGEERLKKALTQCDSENQMTGPDEYCEKICRFVREDISAFSKDADQADDITLLCIKYRGNDI
ncbi:MAG: SpoIIE family protein phosphatase [Lachnospiraceae bacterium]|nr:SpoIIE family protein phosphatase [Lachnospiraceae bacterium]